VIVPALSWPTTYYPLYQYGLHLKFVDVDPQTLNYNLEQLEAAITERTRLVIVVNLLGNPNDFDVIKSMISGKDIALVEDNCESLGAVYKGKQAGTFGLMGTFSSFFSHHISTMEGGYIVTDDEELYQILLCIRSHGWTRSLPKDNLVTTRKSDNNFEESWRFVLPGYNVRPIEMMGAIGIEQLKKFPEFLSWRRKNADYFKKLFAESNDFYIQKEIGKSSWFGFALIIKPDSKLKREYIIQKLQQADIETRPIVAGNFTKNEVLKYFDYELSGKMKSADYIDKYGFFIGNHQFDIRNKIDYFKQIMSDYLQQG
jgi:CDP-6-deoxy-D-xylo-4-hexulose-3-dehydrase